MVFFIGIDIGTSSIKAGLFDRTMKQRAFLQQAYPLINRGAFIEQNPEDWYRISAALVSKLVKSARTGKIGAVSVSTQGGSMVALDKKGDPLYSAISWLDMRSSEEEKIVKEKITDKKIFSITGWNYGHTSVMTKILWLRKHMPVVFAKTYCFAECGSFLAQRMCGRIVIDRTNAAMTQLFNIKSCKWDFSILKYLGLNEERLPQAVPPTCAFTISENFVKDTGLSPDTLFINGAHDQYCSALGAGLQHGEALLSCGTAWVLLLLGKNIHHQKFCGYYNGLSATGNGQGLLVSAPQGGILLDWFRQNILGGIAYSEIDALAQEAVREAVREGGREGALPRTILDKDTLQFANIKIHHTRAHFIRSIMEALAQWTKNSLVVSGGKISQIIMTGGAAKSTIWPQIISDITQRTVRLYKYTEFALRGAACLAARGFSQNEKIRMCTLPSTLITPVRLKSVNRGCQ